MAENVLEGILLLLIVFLHSFLFLLFGPKMIFSLHCGNISWQNNVFFFSFQNPVSEGSEGTRLSNSSTRILRER